MAKRLIPLGFFLLIIFALTIRLLMAAGWGVLFEGFFIIPILFLIFLLAIFSAFQANNRFPTRTASVVYGIYLVTCIFAADFTDENGAYFMGNFYSNENGESIPAIANLGWFTIWIRVGLMGTFLGIYIYGASKPKED